MASIRTITGLKKEESAKSSLDKIMANRRFSCYSNLKDKDVTTYYVADFGADRSPDAKRNANATFGNGCYCYSIVKMVCFGCANSKSKLCIFKIYFMQIQNS